MSNSESREIELKFDLQSMENHSRLLEFLGRATSPALQENLFFDTPDRSLEKAGWAFRVRLEEQRAFITLKGRRSESPEGLAVRTEIESPLPLELALQFKTKGISIENLPEKIADQLHRIAVTEPLTLRLGFRNHRLAVPYPAGECELILEIDRTEFPDGSVDYELEVEIADEKLYERITGEITRLLERCNVPVVFQPKSKFQRAVEKSR